MKENRHGPRLEVKVRARIVREIRLKTEAMARAIAAERVSE